MIYILVLGLVIVSVISMCLYNLSEGIHQCRRSIKYMVNVLIELTKQIQSIKEDTVDEADEADYD